MIKMMDSLEMCVSQHIPSVEGPIAGAVEDESVFYHGSHVKDITQFRPGTHFGTLEQARLVARERAHKPGISGEGHVYQVSLNIKNPLLIQDEGTRIHDVNVVKALKSVLCWSEEKAREVYHDGYKKSPFYIASATYYDKGTLCSNNLECERSYEAYLRDVAEKEGFDGFVYKNRAEGRGDSYVIFRPDQATITKSFTASFAEKVLGYG
ncbi:hypothetical protein KW787_02130 [Candidatus Pacearchaeota archaeon]|nr:hypothetical protein [Candidatus Pacearchaeota archaeon]